MKFREINVPRAKILAKCISVMFTILIILLLIFHIYNLRINVSPSIPIGLYRFHSINVNKAFSVGEIVAVDPKELPIKREFAPHTVLKIIGALPGDKVTSDGHHIYKWSFVRTIQIIFI